jgi:xylulokinase
MLPASLAPAASARGAALLAGLAQGTYDSVEETILIAPKIQEIVLPQDDRYDAAYARYRKLYPRLREP